MKNYRSFFMIFILIAACCGIISANASSLLPAIEGRTNYTAENHLTYSGTYFYYDGVFCAEGCDKYGQNCANGACDVSGCDKQNGYTEFMVKTIKGSKYFLCYNPALNLAYAPYKTYAKYTGDYYYTNFYINDVLCGENCDMDGTNCRLGGICSPKTCDKAKGYTEFVKTDKVYACYNPAKKLSYWTTYNRGKKQFYYNGKRCGMDCDYNGQNCEFETGSSAMAGICNPEDCPKGYYPDGGYCKKENSDKRLYKDKDGKLKNASVRDLKFGAEMTAGAVGYFFSGICGAIFKK